jgi:hypothetical protein
MINLLERILPLRKTNRNLYRFSVNFKDVHPHQHRLATVPLALTDIDQTTPDTTLLNKVPILLLPFPVRQLLERIETVSHSTFLLKMSRKLQLLWQETTPLSTRTPLQVFAGRNHTSATSSISSRTLLLLNLNRNVPVVLDLQVEDLLSRVQLPHKLKSAQFVEETSCLVL